MRKHIILFILSWFSIYTTTTQAKPKGESNFLSAQERDKHNKFGLYVGPTMNLNIIDINPNKSYDCEKYAMLKPGGFGFHIQGFYTLCLNTYLDLELAIGYSSKYAESTYFDKVLRTIRVKQNFDYLQFIPHLNIFIFKEKNSRNELLGFLGGYVEYLMAAKAHEIVNRDKTIKYYRSPYDLKATLGDFLNHWNVGIVFGIEAHFFESGFVIKETFYIGMRPRYDVALSSFEHYTHLSFDISLGYNFGKLLT
jgi:hypothetical protein